MRVAVIGAGLGGLLTSAVLLQKGYKVDVFEKLNFYGGRFTSFNYKGFQISTGALHMIPHGRRGPLGKMLKKIGCKVEIVDSKPEGEILLSERGERIEVRSAVFPLRSKMKFLKWVLAYKLLRKDPTMDSYEKELDELSMGFLRSFLGWSLSISPSDIRFSKLLAIYQRVREHGGPGIPVGGCKKVVDELVEVIKSNNGNLHLRNPVIKLTANEGNDEIQKIITKRGEFEYDFYISNIGHGLTGRLVGKEYCKPEKESKGVKYSISVDEPFIGHTGVLFTLGGRISGMNEVTNADPSLAPKGKHLLMAHQPLYIDAREEIKKGLEELKSILNGYKYEIIAIQSYYNDWPVNRVISGLDFGYKTPYRNLVVVGDGAKGDDIEVDGIALGIERMLSEMFGIK
jgi:phytoene dehydrogenase-like protein